MRSFEKRQPEGGGPLLYDEWKFKIFQTLSTKIPRILSKETFERKRERERKEADRIETRISSRSQTEREKEREREPLRRRFNFVDRFFPERETLSKKKKKRGKNAPSSFVVMVPSPSLSNKANASLNSVICSSVSSAAIVVISFLITRARVL